MKKLLPFILLIALFSSLSHKNRRAFSYTTVYSPLNSRPEWALPPPAINLSLALSQPYFYLGSGAQMISFISADNKTVLKFFKMKRLLKKTPRHRRRLHKAFQSIKIAATKVPAETGIAYAKLNSGLDQHITLYDKKHRCHTFSLNYTPFVLQKKATLIYTHLKNHPLPDTEGQKIIDLVKRRCEKGVADADSGVRANYGFSEGHPLQIDIGELHHHTYTIEEIQLETDRIKSKIQKELSR